MLLVHVHWIPSTCKWYRFVDFFVVVYRSILKKGKYQRLQASIGHLLLLKCLYAIGLIVRGVLILVPPTAIEIGTTGHRWKGLQSQSSAQVLTIVVYIDTQKYCDYIHYVLRIWISKGIYSLNYPGFVFWVFFQIWLQVGVLYLTIKLYHTLS